MEIVEKAIDLHLNDGETTKIKGDNYEGRLFNKKAYFTMGAARGNYIMGVLETDDGKRNLAFLVRQEIDSGLN